MPSRALAYTWAAWVATRAYGVAALHGVFPYRGVFPSDGDLGLYWQWSRALWHGFLPYRDFPLTYPPGAIPFIGLARASLSVYKVEYIAAALVVDLLVMAALLRSGRRAGATLWLLAAPLLGPIFWSRLDIFVAGMLVAAVFAFERGRFLRAALWLTWAALIKIWPLLFASVLLFLIPRRQRLHALIVVVGTLGAVLLPFIALGAFHGLWQVVQLQSGRGVEFESLFAVPLFALDAARHTASLGYAAASVEFHGQADAVVSAMAMVAFAAGAIYVLGRAAYRPLAGTDPERWLLLLVVVLLATNKVLSAQYLVWVAVAVSLILDQLEFHRRLFITCALLLIATQLQFPFGFPQMLAETQRALPLSAVHAVALIFFVFEAAKSATSATPDRGSALIVRVNRS